MELTSSERDGKKEEQVLKLTFKTFRVVKLMRVGQSLLTFSNLSERLWHFQNASLSLSQLAARS